MKILVHFVTSAKSTFRIVDFADVEFSGFSHNDFADVENPLPFYFRKDPYIRKIHEPPK